MSYQLIALDMDGTLLREDKKISPDNQLWIAKALDAGKQVVLATGRPIDFVLPFAAQLGLTSPIVINNGSEIWSNPKTLYQRHELKAMWIERVFDVISAYGDQVRFWADTTLGQYEHGSRPHDPYSVRWLQFGIECDEPSILKEIRRELSGWKVFELTSSYDDNLVLNPQGISKGSGLQEVCRLLGISLDEAIAVGDGTNDLSMICAAGLGVAMGNAQEQLKQQADVIAPTNEEDGVAYIIRHYLLDPGWTSG